MKLIKCNSDTPLCNEQWVVEFYDHKPVSFTRRDDLEKYLNHELSDENGYMEYERVPCGVQHIVYYDIDWK